jgi:hypothetical protein
VVDGGIDEAELALRVLVGEGDDSSPDGRALALVPPCPLIV